MLFFSFILTSCSGNYHLNSLYGKSKLTLNKIQLERFNDYLHGEFYSNELNRKVSHNPIMFAISSDGTTSLLFACASRSCQCNPGVQIYQVLKRYSKKSNKEMYIFALGDKIVWSGNDYLIKNKKLEENARLKNISFNLLDNQASRNTLYDLSIMPNDEDDDFE